MRYSVSRSHEQAAKDVEWPGPPKQTLKQTKLILKRDRKLRAKMQKLMVSTKQHNLRTRQVKLKT